MEMKRTINKIVNNLMAIGFCFADHVFGIFPNRNDYITTYLVIISQGINHYYE